MHGRRLPSLYRATSKSRKGFFMLKISPPEAPRSQTFANGKDICFAQNWTLATPFPGDQPVFCPPHQDVDSIANDANEDDPHDHDIG